METTRHFDPIPRRFRGAGGEAALRSGISKTLFALRFVRGFLVGLTWLSALTFALLAAEPQPDAGVPAVARPALIAMAVMSTTFALILSWKSSRQYRALALRLETVARWMVGTGVTVAFAVSPTVRTELRNTFLLIGIYLLFAVPSLLVTVLLRQRLSRLDVFLPLFSPLDVKVDEVPQLHPNGTASSRKLPLFALAVIGLGVLVMASQARHSDN
jgi:hypothetical protein